jgi:hypothetical protein
VMIHLLSFVLLCTTSLTIQQTLCPRYINRHTVAVVKNVAAPFLFFVQPKTLPDKAGTLPVFFFRKAIGNNIIVF